MSTPLVRQVFESSRSSGTERVVLLAMAMHISKDGFAWPSIDRVAGWANVNRRNTIRAIQSLIERGELVPAGKGPKGVIKYRIELPLKGVDPDTSGGVVCDTLEQGLSPERPVSIATRGGVAGDTAGGVAGDTQKKKIDILGTDVPRISDTSPKRTEAKAPKKNGADIDADFDTWWQLVPLRKGKGQARRAYRSARKKISADELTAGITRYAEELERTGDLIAHPATWLNGERWTDEPTPDRAARSRPGAARGDLAAAASRAMSRAEILERS